MAKINEIFTLCLIYDTIRFKSKDDIILKDNIISKENIDLIRAFSYSLGTPLSTEDIEEIMLYNSRRKKVRKVFKESDDIRELGTEIIRRNNLLNTIEWNLLKERFNINSS